MKYTVESCLFPESSTSPALTACESTCSPLDVVLTYSWFTNGQASAGQYDYCAQNGSVFVQYAGGCANCLKTQKDSVILGNCKLPCLYSSSISLSFFFLSEPWENSNMKGY